MEMSECYDNMRRPGTTEPIWIHQDTKDWVDIVAENYDIQSEQLIDTLLRDGLVHAEEILD